MANKWVKSGYLSPGPNHIEHVDEWLKVILIALIRIKGTWFYEETAELGSMGIWNDEINHPDGTALGSLL